MTFRTNTKPILKTKDLSWSLQKTYIQLYNEYTQSQLTELENEINDQYRIFISIKDNMGTFTRELKKKNALALKWPQDNGTTQQPTKNTRVRRGRDRI